MHSIINQLSQNYPDLLPCIEEVQAAFDLLVDTFASDHSLLVCGNGGSAADADHIVGELVKGFMLKRPLPESDQTALKTNLGKEGSYLSAHLQGGLRAIALTAHTALSTAVSNDVASDLVFAQQVHVYSRKGDVLMGLTTSGCSTNVLYALRIARAKGVKTIGLTGKSGGDMSPLCDVLIKVPFEDPPRIQERHLPIYHALCLALEQHFFGNVPG